MSVLDSVLNEINEDSARYLENYLMNAPRWIVETFRSVNIPEGYAFIRENDPVDSIYILVKGEVVASDFRIEQASYDFMKFGPVEFFGAMEILADIDTYMTTLTTTKDSKFILVSGEHFAKWMKSDMNALSMQTKAMTLYLLEQNRKDRLNLFLQGYDRMAFFFVMLYKRFHKNGKITICLKREEMARDMALSVRTVNRAIREMFENNIIEKSGTDIVLYEDKYEYLRNQLSQKVDITDI